MNDWVVYHKLSTMEQRSYSRERFARMLTEKLNEKDPGAYGYCHRGWYDNAIVHDVVVHNLMTGTPVVIKSNTPPSCDPSMETYWSM